MGRETVSLYDVDFEFHHLPSLTNPGRRSDPSIFSISGYRNFRMVSYLYSLNSHFFKYYKVLIIHSGFAKALAQGFLSEEHIGGTGPSVTKPGTGKSDNPLVPGACGEPAVDFGF